MATSPSVASPFRPLQPSPARSRSIKPPVPIFRTAKSLPPLAIVGTQVPLSSSPRTPNGKPPRPQSANSTSDLVPSPNKNYPTPIVIPTTPTAAMTATPRTPGTPATWRGSPLRSGSLSRPLSASSVRSTFALTRPMSASAVRSSMSISPPKSARPSSARTDRRPLTDRSFLLSPNTQSPIPTTIPHQQDQQRTSTPRSGGAVPTMVSMSDSKLSKWNSKLYVAMDRAFKDPQFGGADMRQIVDVFKEHAKWINSDVREAYLEYKTCRAAFITLGLDGVLAERCFHVMNASGTGRMTLDEFMIGMNVFFGGTFDEKLRLAFSLFDSTNDGKLDREEALALVSLVFFSFNDGTAILSKNIATKRFFDEMDTDKDGFISWDEFATNIKNSILYTRLFSNFMSVRKMLIPT